jgi:radical SAM superfamily enzyme
VLLGRCCHAQKAQHPHLRARYLFLPGETHEMMLDTGRAVAQMDMQGIKIHLLHLMRITPLVKQYEAGLLRFLEKDEYVNLIVDTLKFPPPEMIVHRLIGDAPRDLLISPMWSLKKWGVLNILMRS